MSEPDDSPQFPEALPYLAGGGAMGARIRSHDWSASLGSPLHWPPSLRTALRILLSTNHPVFIFWGPEHICFYNDSYARSLGPERHPSILGRPGREAWDEIWDIIGPQIELVMAGRGATWHQNQLVPTTRHGRREDVYWTYSYSPIDDPASASGVGGVLVLCTETTDSVLTAKRLEASEARWHSLFQQVPGFMCILRGPDHVYEYANPAYFKRVGDIDLIGRPLASVFPWTVDQGYVALLDDVYRSGIAFEGHEAPILLPDHDGTKPAYVDFVYQPIRGEDGEINGIFVLGTDVTDRKEAEAAVLDSENRLRIACEASALGIHDYDVLRDAIRWDARVRELWGVGPEEDINYDVFEAGLHPEDRARTRAAVEAALDPAGSGRYWCEFRVIHRRDGRQRWIQANGQAFFSEGRATRLVGSVLDITDRKEADTRRDEFLATLGHELRNPLAPISNAAQLLFSKAEHDPDLAWASNVITRQVNVMARLLEDLLDVSRISQGKLELRRRRTSLAEVIAAAAETSRPHIDAARQTLETSLPPGPVILNADPVRLAQVFSNLLNNASKFTRLGGAIRIAARAEGDRVAITVADNGSGMHVEELPTLFQIFSQSPRAGERARSGLGIGLWLVRGLVELHDGSVDAHSDGPGKGSEFVVRLPIFASPLPVTQRAYPDPPADVERHRILVVDDVEDGTDSLVQLLRAHGHEASGAYGGREGLEAAAALRPDVMFIDIGMPDIDGLEVCRRMRLHPWGRRVRLVAMTGWGQEEDRRRTQAAGFDHHLTKPVDHDVLQALLRSITGTAGA